jgi:hypothetical protein
MAKHALLLDALVSELSASAGFLLVASPCNTQLSVNGMQMQTERYRSINQPALQHLYEVCFCGPIQVVSPPFVALPWH